jgi:hypothetical protein
MCQPAGDEPQARSNATVLDRGGWTIRWHQPPTAREDDPGLLVVATVMDPISRATVDHVTFRKGR